MGPRSSSSCPPASCPSRPTATARRVEARVLPWRARRLEHQPGDSWNSPTASRPPPAPNRSRCSRKTCCSCSSAQKTGPSAAKERSSTCSAAPCSPSWR
ncbi:hypothetical protein ACFPRL_19740 [Pseudoclavibacter helvolus]